ncbi:hypothetical protein ASG11_15505 [Sphingomonas sp. Leaf357]|uniref:PEPxxWA-CTERM sorting domain-containing protein n=1 Tax=Sphingomonas sp. Leaf357 TaxID=1736350 RepID=UPI0006F27E03|nr:PEPxxWA-CTERM sorting domain-containing protein [Sphingomonas sp. Leaf357]KQS02185.1 hypothetical protein ASG11_15505 [Sphingomonas sp. Leaf357]
MKTMTKMMIAATFAVSGLAAGTAANAAIVINITQVGADVRADASGTADTTGAAPIGLPISGAPFINGSRAAVRVGSGAYYNYAVSGPTVFGSNFQVTATTASGSLIAVNGMNQTVQLLAAYTSNSFISGTATFANQTLASLGLTLGSYVYRLPNDTLTVNIGPVAAAVPETATWAMMIAGFGMMGAAMRTRRRSTKVSFA